MKILTLSIKQQNFDDILSGEKTQEFREVRPTTQKKYLKFISNGKTYDDLGDVPDGGEIGADLIQYDAIKFLTGAYEGVRPFAIVEVKDIAVDFITGDDDLPVPYEVNGKRYFLMDMTYTLGKVLERSK
ncbi:MAG: ASCH domain-containing protein [Mucinivorans sp.]